MVVHGQCYDGLSNDVGVGGYDVCGRALLLVVGSGGAI